MNFCTNSYTPLNLDITIVKMNSDMIRLGFIELREPLTVGSISYFLWVAQIMSSCLKVSWTQSMKALCFNTISTTASGSSLTTQVNLTKMWHQTILQASWKRRKWEILRFYPMPFYCAVVTEIKDSRKLFLIWPTMFIMVQFDLIV